MMLSKYHGLMHDKHHDYDIFQKKVTGYSVEQKKTKKNGKRN